MSEFSLADMRDMAPAYVLGALSADEHAAFERALSSSAELSQEVLAYRSVISRIGTDSELSPPTALRARFLDRIATQRQAATPVPPTVPAAPAVDPRPMTVSSGGIAAASRSSTEKPKADRWWLTGIMAVGLAASLLFALQRDAQVSTLTASLASRDTLLQIKTVKLAQRDSALNTVLEAERNLVLVNLGAVDNGPGIQFFWNVKQRRGVLHAFNLKPAASGRTYQLWLIKDGKPVSARLFNADPDEHGLVWGIELPEGTKGVSALAVTEEPAGGSPQPTSTPFLVGELPKGIQ
ncbi:MAG: anti-sigma factor [Gemmatimonadaceae bacterium]